MAGRVPAAGDILLIGANGQLGWELLLALQPLGRVQLGGRAGHPPFLQYTAHHVDLRHPDTITRTLRTVRPRIVVNAAAYTKVDLAEEEQALAAAINGVAPGVMAEEARRIGAVLIHYSTDYVFDGNSPIPYRENDPAKPLNVYGRTKLEGEQAVQAADGAHLILRTSWIYGKGGTNFLKTMLRLAVERDELPVVDDQVGAPTWSRIIAAATVQLLGMGWVHEVDPYSWFKDVSGIYHMTSSGRTTWFGFAREILAKLDGEAAQRCILRPIPTAQYPTAAARPRLSLLSNEKLKATFHMALPEWKRAFDLCWQAEFKES